MLVLVVFLAALFGPVASSSAILPSAHEFLLPGGMSGEAASSTIAVAPPTPGAFPPPGTAYLDGAGGAIYNGNGVRTVEGFGKTYMQLHPDGSYTYGLNEAFVKRLRANSAGLADQAVAERSLANGVPKPAWRTLGRTMGALDESALSRLGGATFMKAIGVTMAGTLLPAAATVLTAAAAVGTAYQVCSAFLKAGCWLFSKEATANSYGQANGGWLGSCRVIATRDGCNLVSTGTFKGLDGVLPAALAGGLIDIYEWTPGTYSSIYEAEQSARVNSPPTGYGYCFQPTVSGGPPGGGTFLKSPTAISCEYGNLYRGAYYRVTGSNVGNNVYPPGHDVPSGTPTYGGSVPGIDGGQDALAASGLGTDDLATLAGAAVASGVPSVPATTPMPKPGPLPTELPPGTATTTVPLPHPGEDFHDYLRRLEEQGIKVKTKTLTDPAVNPNGLPGNVENVYPPPGTEVSKGTDTTTTTTNPDGSTTTHTVIENQTTVTITVNPSTNTTNTTTNNYYGGTTADPSTNPTTEGSAQPQSDADPLPTIDLSPLRVGLGGKFPFGVPGWVASKLGGFGGGGSCPVFNQSLPFGQSIRADGCVIEPARSIYRPVLVVCSFIGLAWAFMAAALGFGAGGGDD